MSSRDFERWFSWTKAKAGPRLDDCFKSVARREAQDAKDAEAAKRPVYIALWNDGGKQAAIALRSVEERLARRANEDHQEHSLRGLVCRHCKRDVDAVVVERLCKADRRLRRARLRWWHR